MIAMLNKLANLFKSDSLEDSTSLGKIAIELGWVKQEDLELAVKYQENQLPIGQLLIDIGKITPEQRDALLLEQSRRRARNTSELAAIELQHQRTMISYIKNNLTELTVASTTFIAAAEQIMKGHK